MTKTAYKAVVGALVAGLGVAVSNYQDGAMSHYEWLLVVNAVMIAFNAIYFTVDKTKPAKTE